MPPKWSHFLLAVIKIVSSEVVARWPA